MAGEKILNIDDSPTVQRLIEMILSSQGYQVLLASDGEAGIAVAKAEKPEVILVDFVMPKMNGFQVCKTLKEDPEFRDTPIILVTSKGDKVGSKFVDVLGITEYFTKPFQPEELLAKIREVIDRRQDANGSSAGAVRKPAAAAPTPSAHPAPSSEPHAALPDGLGNVVRDLVEKALDEFVTTRLPALVRQELGRGSAAAGAGIQGNLASFRIVEVMQMLGMQRQTGRLSITRRSDSAEIYFGEGTVVFASSAAAGGGIEAFVRKSCGVEEDGLRHALRIAEMTGQPIDSVLAQEKLIDLEAFADCLRRHTECTVYKVMAWRDGDFVFENAAPPQFTMPLQLKVDDLLLEGARRADEWTLIQQKITNYGMVFAPMIGNAEELTTRGMSDADLKVFSLIDGKRTIQDIIDAANLDEFDVAKSMFILHSVNLIRKTK